MNDRRDWTGVRWTELGDTYEVISGQGLTWMYKRTRDGELLGGGVITETGLLERTVDTELAPAQPTPAGGGATADFDELLTQLSNSLSNHAISMLRTHFAAEHSIRTRVEAQLAADDSGYSELIDKLSGRIKSLERENATMIRELAMLEGERNRLRQQLAAAQSALKECVVQMVSHGNDDNWETLTMPYAEAINQARAALEATDGGAGISNE